MTVSTLAPRARRRMQPPPPADPVTQYALDVVAGRIVAGVLVRKACERHLRDLADGQSRGLYWEWTNPDPTVMTGKKAVEFFGLLRHYKGDLGRADEGKGALIHLEAWQVFIVGSAFGWKRADGLRRFRSVYLEVAKKNGKALALDTPIPTPTGWTTMAELRTGDEVLDETGRRTRVTFATEVMRDHDCYRVAFSDGTSVIADADHQWLTERLDHHRYVSGVRTTRNIADSLLRADGAHRHRIPICEPLALPEVDLPIDPYVLGVWLGDGDTGQALITVGDQDAEMLSLVASAGVAVHPRPRSAGRAARFRLGSNGASHSRSEVATAMRHLGVMGNKHIPALYLRASAAQRLSLLQGLMDTDGHVTERGQCEFTTTRPRLRDDFLELARSLGYKAISHESVATLDGRAIGPKWRITFHGRRDRAPFRLSRKLIRVRAASATPQRSHHRHIVAVESVPSVPVRCIQVDSPSHLFLAGEAMIPTHNTLLGAGVMLLLTFFDDEPGAEGYSLATKEDQAKLSWKDGAQFAAKNASIAARIRKVGNRLVNEQSASFWMPLGRDSDTGDQGINAHSGLVDELHVLDSRDPIDNLETATSARSQPMIWKITTAGVKRESVWADERADAVAILEGRATDDSVLALVYTLDEGDDPFDEAVWPKANPNLGVSVRIDTLREQAEKAKRSPGKLNAFLRYRMNIPTAVATRAISIEEWDANAGEPVINDGDGCYMGLDLASVRDLTALIGLFRHDDEYSVLCRFWCPEEGIVERSRRDGVPYDDWVRDGYLTATPGNVTDYDYIEEEVKQLAKQYGIGEIGFDKWNATQLSVDLMADGANMVAIPQTHAGLGPAWREFEKLILDRKLRHGGHPILRWMAGNVETETDAQGNQKPSKRHSTERIDGIVALLMALSRWMANGEAPAVWTAA